MTSTRPLYETTPVFAVTADVDWASEDAIALLQDIVDAHGARATYFVTHASALLDVWRRQGRVDLGIHPNFLPGSSHGDSFETVLDTVCTFAPGARASRSHMYFDASPVTRMLVERGFLYDSNLVTNLQTGLAPIRHGSGLVRLPCFFEDGTHSWQRIGWNFEDVRARFEAPGLKILSVHPMTLAMNVASQERWAELKRRFPLPHWTQMDAPTLATEADRGPGPRTFFEDALSFIKRAGYPLLGLDEIYRQFVREVS